MKKIEDIAIPISNWEHFFLVFIEIEFKKLEILAMNVELGA